MLNGIENFFRVYMQAGPLREISFESAWTVLSHFEYFSFIGGQVAPAQGCINGSVKEFCIKVTALVCVHNESLH
ncbi:hypothetical protein [Pseudomonas sp. H2_E02]